MMISSKGFIACIGVTIALSLASCENGNKAPQSATKSPNSSSETQSNNTSSSTKTSSNAEAEVEKIKPAPGTGNVQGKVLYNSKPATNIEVKLCEKFSRFIGGCSGKTYTARTDKNGEYVITNVKPKMYEALLSRVFDTDSYVFATTGVGGLSSTQYEVAPDKTLFISSTHLFKSDLKLINPKAGAKVSPQNLELKWQAYPEATYYKFSIYPDDVKITSPYVNERIDGTTFSIDKPLQKGTYRWQVEAYNNADQKLAESSRDIKFTIN